MSHIFRAFAVLAMLGSFALAQNAGSTQTDPAAKPSPISKRQFSAGPTISAGE